MNSNKDKLYLKIEAFNAIYDFVVEKFLNKNCLGSGMTQPFMDRDDTDEQVWGPKRSIYEFRDLDDTAVQV